MLRKERTSTIYNKHLQAKLGKHLLSEMVYMYWSIRCDSISLEFEVTGNIGITGKVNRLEPADNFLS